MRRAGTIAILIVTAIAIPAYLWLGVLGMLPQPSFGMQFSTVDGEVRNVSQRGAAKRAGVANRDHVLDLARGDAAAGFRLADPRDGDAVRVQTAHGIVTVRAGPVRPAPADAASIMAAQISAVIVIAFATLLCLRRPGVLAFSFWLYALASIPSSVMLLGLAPLPSAIGMAIFLPLNGFIGNSFAVPLIPFALRFPDGGVRGPRRWGEALAWIGFVALAGAGAWWVWFVTVGAVDQWNTSWIFNSLPSVPLPIAAAILAWRYIRSAATIRAQTAWALAGFGLSILAQAAAFVNVTLAYAFLVNTADVRIIENILVIVANLTPLLAIYPILRHRLFDLGFVVNRATLYSVLTLAAVGTLAAVNWIAQHFITERLVTLLQPIAAIAIGFGYMRVRGWVQRVLERTIFRERFAAEVQLEATMKTFALTDHPATIDDALTGEAARALSLSSARVIRDASASLAARQHGEDVVAIELRNGDALVGVVLYGPHLNGTEIDPEELRLLHRLCDAAAAAYRNAELQSELLRLQGRIAALEARPATT